MPSATEAEHTGAELLRPAPNAVPAGTDSRFVLLAGSWTLPLVALWLLVALFRLGRLASGYCAVLHIRRNLQPLDPRVAARVQFRLQRCGLRQRIELAESDLLPVPALLGFCAPVVVLPRAVTSTLSASELDLVGLHESAHARRRDQWSNLVQRLVECFFFYHPAVMWVCRRLTLEREIACDDWVVAATGRPRPYATCLARLVECAQHSLGGLPVTGAVSTRHHIFRRVEALLTKRDSRSPRLSPAATLVAALLLSAAAFEIGVSGPRLVVARADSHDATPAPQRLAVPSPPAVPPTDASVPRVPAPPAPAPSPTVSGLAQSVPSAPAVPPTPDAPTPAPAARGLAAADRRLSEADRRLTNLDKMDFAGSVSVHSDDGQYSASWSDGRHKMRVEMDGDITFTGDTGVAQISRDGYFRIEERNGSERHELEIAPGRTGELEYYYSEGGRSKPYDAQAKAWLARALPEIMRQTGLNAAERTARIFHAGGADAVLGETAKIESEYVRRLYFEELLKLDGGQASTVHGILRQVLARFDSDYETAELLVAMAPYAQDDSEARDAYFQAALRIDSDYETRRVLSAIGRGDQVDPAFARAALQVAGRMDSDYEKAELLIEASDLCRTRPELRRDYLAVLRGMDSDYEKRRTLDALGDLDTADDDFVQGVLEMAGTIDSDYERAELLVGMSGHAVQNDRLLKAYIAAAGEISSDYEKRRALAALKLRDDTGEDVLLDLLDAAAGIDSDYEKAEYFLAIGPLYARSARLEDALRTEVDRIDSDYERERVEASLWRQSRRSRDAGRRTR